MLPSVRRATHLDSKKNSGAVAFTRCEGQILYAVLRDSTGVCGFPTGPVADAETDMQAAGHLICVETGLLPALIDGFCLRWVYPHSDGSGVQREDVFFLAAFHGDLPDRQAGDVQQIHLLPFLQALNLISDESCRRLLGAAHTFLTGGVDG